MRTLIIAFAIAAAATGAEAQHPDFSGTWTRVDSAPGGRGVAATGDAAFRRGDMGSGWGSPLTLTQTADRLSVVFDVFIAYDLQPKARQSYALDGSESKNSIMISHAEMPLRSWAKWEGESLVIETKFVAPPGVDPRPRENDVRQSLSIDAAGRLVIETRRHDANATVNTIVTSYTKR